MLVSDINDYRTENIVHPSTNMSTYCTKFVFLLKDNNNKTCHRICTTFIVILLVTDQQLTIYAMELVLCMIKLIDMNINGKHAADLWKECGR